MGSDLSKIGFLNIHTSSRPVAKFVCTSGVVGRQSENATTPVDTTVPAYFMHAAGLSHPRRLDSAGPCVRVCESELEYAYSEDVIENAADFRGVTETDAIATSCDRAVRLFLQLE